VAIWGAGTAFAAPTWSLKSTSCETNSQDENHEGKLLEAIQQ
jgi:hypothetical protein